MSETVLITGAGKRIGRSLALRLAGEGYRVAIHYSASEEEARRTAAECGDAPIFKADLESVAQIEKLFQDVAARFGRLDALVNNAARFARIDALDITEKDWDFIHSVNLKATFFCCQQAARLMLKSGGGRIVNISSLGGIRPWAEHAHYCASKAGVIMLTQALAKAFAPTITVNSIAPGVILEPSYGADVARAPAQRAGTPEDIAAAVLYFLQSSKFVTGQTLAVDGGLSLR